MARPADPYHTLGLPRGASLDEVKRAYRRLAKANHPDAAGEGALPRFLAIQEAYDRIVGGDGGAGGSSTRRPAAPRQPWEADPTRADATHRAYGGRSRRARSGGSARPRPEPGPPPPPPPGSRRPPRAPNKATLGSTSYDGADAEPFDPDWGGASWYGTSSGTYWTINPKEYADPRKHGPEYQARARRAATSARAADGDPEAAPEAGPSADTPPPEPEARPDPGPGPAAGAEPGSATGAATGAATHTTSSWWEATAGAEADETADGAADVEAATPAMPWGWLEGPRPGVGARVTRAALGWVPLALGLAWVTGEVSGCGRFAADCDPTTGWLVLLAQVGLLGLLLAVPRIAAVAAVAGIATVVAAMPAALVVAGAARGTGEAPVDATAGMAILGWVLVVAWVVGAGVGVARAVRARSRPVS